MQVELFFKSNEPEEDFEANVWTPYVRFLEKRVLQTVFPSAIVEVQELRMLQFGWHQHVLVRISDSEYRSNLPDYLSQMLSTPYAAELRALHLNLLKGGNLVLAELLLRFQDVLEEVSDIRFAELSEHDFAGMMLGILQSEYAELVGVKGLIGASKEDLDEWIAACMQHLVSSFKSKKNNTPTHKRARIHAHS